MIEEIGGEDAAPADAAGDAAAWALLGRATREKADAYLDEQTSLIRLQKEHLHEQRLLLLSHLKWRRFDDQLKGALQIMLVIIGAAVVIALGAAVWNASQANGLVVDSFSVPPSFAQSGITGEALADDVTGLLAEIRDRGVRNSFSNSADVSKASQNAIRVEIPDTGISIAEAWRYLRSWLGHERHLSGSLRQAADGIVTLKLSLDGGGDVSVSGPASALPKLERDAVEQVFERFDPINHIVYLFSQSRYREAHEAAQRFVPVAQGRQLQADSYSLLGETTRLATGDLREAVAHERVGMMIDPDLATTHLMASRDLAGLGHDEDSLHEAQAILTLKDSDQLPQHRGVGFAAMRQEASTAIAVLLGDFQNATAWDCGHGCGNLGWRLLIGAGYKARMHDVALAREMLAQADAANGVRLTVGTALARPQSAEVHYWIDAGLQDWKTAAGDARSARVGVMHSDGDTSMRYLNQMASVHYDPLIAIADAHLGAFQAAHRVIDTTAGDCYLCMRARGVIAALEGRRQAAAWWFARAIAQAPSIPFAYADWGAMLLHEGQYDAAIAKFALAHDKSPHFADPLEMWGEALMLQNRSDLALAKFAEAEKYAPNWGRLHLKWGEALFYAGKRSDAKKLFAIAAGLDLSPSDKTALEHWMTLRG
jgi:tetratricopeptide (TPR) repeat protein